MTIKPNYLHGASFRRAAPRLQARSLGSIRRSPMRSPAFRGGGFALPIPRARQERKSPSPPVFRRPGPVAKGSARVPHIDQTDPTAAGRAQAAVAAINGRYEGLIAEISENQGLSETQKAAAIVGLRYQQAGETADAAQAIIEQARAGHGAQPRTMRKEQSAGQDPGDVALAGGNSGASSDSKSSVAPGAIRGLFKAAAKDVTRCAENPQPRPRRRRGETDKGSVPMQRILSRSGAVARGRYAVLQAAQQQPVAPANAYDRATLYLSDTLDWLNLWQDNVDNDYWYEDEFSAKQEHYSLQL